METMQETLIFQNRVDAGRQLAWKLSGYRDDNPLVLALPRSGVVVGYEVANALNAPLDVLVAHKLSARGHPEIGIGAVAPGNVRIIYEDVMYWLHLSPARLDDILAHGTIELDRRQHLYRGDRPLPDLRDRTVILVDDGIATGMTAFAALLSLQQRQPKRVILAAPVCARQTAEMISGEVDHLVCASIPDHFRAVGLWYRDFPQVTDEQVIALLERNRQEHGGIRIFNRSSCRRGKAS